MRLKILPLIVGLSTLLLSALALFFVLIGKSPDRQSDRAILFKNRSASLFLEEMPSTAQEFIAYLRVSAPQCNGALAQKGDGGSPAKAFLKTGTLKKGLLDIHQPPTMGEAACDLELRIQNDEIIMATQQGGDCNAWHGPSCAFTTPTLGGMKRYPKSPLDIKEPNS